MQFDDDADLDTSEVSDVRGSRILGGKATVGGGIAGLIALILGLLFGVGPDQLGLSSGDSGTTATASSAAQVEQSCRTGQDANARDDCRTVAVVNSVQDFWRQEFARRGARYGDARTVLFTDRIVSNAVKVELQADCYAGVWAHHATTTPDESTGRPLITSLTQADIRDGLDAAAAVGDDRIQEKFQGWVTPESWTHGSAAQRQQWFTTGFRSGDMADCNTFR
ncbi:neutral zinc metallopeptidase [Streptomyces sp. NBC_00841]|uniref:neutral zinc metallopeptidase n=1 Tax=unclassified Streptomyces TaxID=2593676 RepID=UPI00225917FB|nr:MULTISPECIES: neutral zinc metallopeptidase [unclassified Streptomyces]MCX4535897.1 neutral zinc metallopeptidase [Streptomyces sp. NBC_01669]WRZ98831.1 neutral zinc metallopeptidase [Streptomyces sp. NBC_00841]